MATRRTMLVTGCGAVGSAVALTLARAGFRVVAVDPGPPGDNASGIAAGMLAPAFETLFDRERAGGFQLLAQARDAWTAFAELAGVGLSRESAIAVGGEGEARDWAAELERIGAHAEVLAPGALAARAPGLAGGLWGVATSDDWRLAPRPSLAALRRAAEARGASFLADRVIGFEPGRARLEGAGPIEVERLVLATGAAPEPASIAPELARLAPVKGHILRSPEPWAPSAVVRAPGVYLCPDGEGGLVVGASMEPGAADAAIDPAVVEALLARADALAPGLRGRTWRAQTGVRAATPDGLPLLGASVAPGVIVAAGARRNGWLLAPLIAAAVLDLIEERDVAGPAAAFAPARPATGPG